MLCLCVKGLFLLHLILTINRFSLNGLDLRSVYSTTKSVVNDGMIDNGMYCIRSICQNLDYSNQ